jgi:hypothetical protein
LSLAVLAGCSSTVDGSPTSSGPTTTASTPASRAPVGPEFTPGEGNEDPSTDIEGVVVTEYEPLHVEPGRRVAYEKAPPDGGRHDQVWADCDGAVYRVPVRNEHMVHALEHGAVWIAYNADQVTGDALASLVGRVENQPYLMLSPYPGLDQPISLQSWGHQLKLADADDPRIDQFVQALRENPYTAPEPGAPCGSRGSAFDVTSPPPFEADPPGPEAAPVGAS